MTKEQGGNTSLNMAALYDQENVIEPRIEHIVNHAADMEKATTDGQLIMSRGTTEAEKNDDNNLPEKAKSVGTDSVEPKDHALGTPERLNENSNIFSLVQQRRLEVPRGHLTRGCLSEFYNRLFRKDIPLSCMLFLPRVLTSSRKPILEVRFIVNSLGKIWKDIHVIDDSQIQPVKGDDDEIVLRPGTLTITCQLGEKGPKSHEEAIHYSDMKSRTKMTKYFQLDMTREKDETVLKLEMVQNSPQTIICKTRFQGIDKETTEQYAQSPTTDEISSDKQIVTDAHILKLAGSLSPNLWHHLYVPLKIKYCIAEGIREKSRETTEQYIHLLQTWKATSTRTRKELNEILNEIGAGGLVDTYLD